MAVNAVELNDLISAATALGTVSAALFAAMAARSASRSAKSAEQLIDLEQKRDLASDERAVRSVLVELRSHSVTMPNGQEVTIAICRVANSGPTPVTKCRVRVNCGGQTYGPQLFGSLPPGMAWELVAPLAADDDKSGDLSARVRFVSVVGDSWTATATGDFERDDALTAWVAEGRAWASVAASWPEFWRGLADGPFPLTYTGAGFRQDDLNDWMATFQPLNPR